MNAPVNGVTRRRSHAEVEATQRYYLHHHAPNHHTTKPLGVLRHVSTSGIAQLRHSHVRQSHSTTPDIQRVSSTLKPKRKTSMSTNHLSALSQVKEAPKASLVKNVVRGHALSPATCSRLRQNCESCQHTVHKHGYLYCLHCPVVCHFREQCIKEIPRNCPSMELGIQGWGESRQPIKFMPDNTLDLESVFLSGMLGLQSNKCYECGNVLNPSGGHEFTATGTDESSERSHAKRHSKKESGLRRTNSAHHTNDTSQIRVCHMTGKYYCARCHWNDQWYIPGSILLLNDVSQQPVCRSVYLKLRVVWDSAVYRIPSYWHKENLEAGKVFNIRDRLQRLYRFTLTCPNASAIREYTEVTEPAYLLGNPNHFRFCDMMELLRGSLCSTLEQYLERLTEHVNTCDQCISDSGTVVPGNFISLPGFAQQDETESERSQNVQ